MTASVRQHQVLMVMAVVIPALLFTGAALQNRGDVWREGGETVLRTVAVMQEHARKVFETAELAIGQIDERIDDLDEAAVMARPTSDLLWRLRQSMDQVVSIWISNRDGMIEAASQAWPPGASIADRTFFQAQKAADLGTMIDSAMKGRATGRESFAVVRRRSTAGRAFAGTIHISVGPDYFSGFYAEIAPPFEHESLLLRAKGDLLAIDPAASVLDRRAPAWILPHLSAAEPDGVLFSGQNEAGQAMVGAVRKVGAYPVFVAFTVPHTVLLARWHRNLVIYGTVAASTALMLLVLSWLALRRAQAEQHALSQLRAEVAQRETAEAQLRHAQRMDAVGQLTGGVAHDFNNLLTAILGSLELIQRAGTRPDGAERITRLTAIAIKAVQRGSGLTKSLLAFARKQPLQPVHLDANALVLEFRDFLGQAVGVGIPITVQPAPDLPPCFADPAELQGALLNLAINARDAMPKGGHLIIHTTVTYLAAADLVGNAEARPGRFVGITVADTGCGMPPEVAAQAFEPFFTTKPIGQGTGLGLSQVFGFVRQLGGHVTICTAPGVGTSISLFLPALAENAAPGAAAA